MSGYTLSLSPEKDLSTALTITKPGGNPDTNSPLKTILAKGPHTLSKDETTELYSEAENSIISAKAEELNVRCVLRTTSKSIADNRTTHRIDFEIPSTGLRASDFASIEFSAVPHKYSKYLAEIEKSLNSIQW